MIACQATGETYIRVGGKWRYLLLAVDQFGQLFDFHLTARRAMNAARTFFGDHEKQSVITTDKEPNYLRDISEMNKFCFSGDHWPLSGHQA